MNTPSHFSSLHSTQQPLVLANAWDVASARVIEAAGAPAIATTSAGVAWSLGRPDGDVLSRVEATAAVARIAAAVEVPVSADIEGGLADDPAGVETTVAGMLRAGVVGINIEDGTRLPEDFCARVHAARRAADRAGAELFVNARTDVYLAGIGDPRDRLAETLTRAASYLAAGADGVFVPGVSDPATIAALADGIGAPLNVMAGPGSPTVSEFGRLGVARVSLGSSIAQAAYAAAHLAASDLLAFGTYESVADGVDYGRLNALLQPAVSPCGGPARASR